MAVLIITFFERMSPINQSNIFLMISKVNFNGVKNAELENF